MVKCILVICIVWRHFLLGTISWFESYLTASDFTAFSDDELDESDEEESESSEADNNQQQEDSNDENDFFEEELEFKG